jgi:carbamoyl-phosphate synthase/aspartate carbamoyltransferase
MTIPIPSLEPNGIQRVLNGFTSFPVSPIVSSLSDGSTDWLDGVLELVDGSAYRGISFGAGGKSVSGECVFQTGTFYS